MEDLSKLPHVFREPGRRPAYRRRFSADAIKALGKTHFQRSLGASSDPKALRAAYDRLEAEFLRLQARATDNIPALEADRRAQTQGVSIIGPTRVSLDRLFPDDPALPLLGYDDAAALVSRFFSERLRALDMDRVDLRSMDDHNQEVFKREVEHRLDILSDPDNEDGFAFAQSEAAALLRRYRYRSTVTDPAGKRLHNLTARALFELARLEMCRAEGDYSDVVLDREFVGSVAAAPAVQTIDRSGGSEENTLSIQEAVDRYLSEALLRPGRKQKTNDRYETEMKHIVEFWDGERRVGSLTRRDCVDFRATFSNLPPNFAKIRGDGSLRDVAANRKDDVAVLKWETLEKYLSAMRRFIAWANREDLIAKDFASDIKPLAMKPDGSMAKLPFEAAELRLIVQRPIYTGCKDDGNGFARVGPNIVRRSRYWLPLISLFGGLRAGEILQLAPHHVRVSPTGNDFIVLTRDMALKNDNAEREIPVHPMLKRIGFVEWVARRRDHSPDGLLFPEVPADKYETTSPTFSKRYRSDLKHFKLGDRRDKLTFHSYRHTFKQALIRADVPEHHQEELCGWTRGKKTSRRYGIGQEADVLMRYVEQVSYDVDFSHLLGHANLDD